MVTLQAENVMRNDLDLPRRIHVNRPISCGHFNEIWWGNATTTSNSAPTELNVNRTLFPLISWQEFSGSGLFRRLKHVCYKGVNFCVLVDLIVFSRDTSIYLVPNGPRLTRLCILNRWSYLSFILMKLRFSWFFSSEIK